MNFQKSSFKMYWFGLSWLEMNHSFLTNKFRQIHSPFCYLIHLLTEKEKWAYPNKKAQNHSTSYWKAVPHNVISDKGIANAFFFFFFFLIWVIIFQYLSKRAYSKREGKWEMRKIWRSNISWDVFKSYRANLMFIVHRKHLCFICCN